MVKFFRHCPGCGRRLHIRLENKKMVRSERRTYRGTRTFHVEGPSETVTIEDFQYTYKCDHCGHKWTENHVVTGGAQGIPRG